VGPIGQSSSTSERKSRAELLTVTRHSSTSIRRFPARIDARGRLYKALLLLDQPPLATVLLCHQAARKESSDLAAAGETSTVLR
jgi:hypothetical protein